MADNNWQKQKTKKEAPLLSHLHERASPVNQRWFAVKKKRSNVLNATKTNTTSVGRPNFHVVSWSETTQRMASMCNKLRPPLQQPLRLFYLPPPPVTSQYRKLADVALRHFLHTFEGRHARWQSPGLCIIAFRHSHLGREQIHSPGPPITGPSDRKHSG